MSVQAIHRVITGGPDDHLLFRVLIVVADYSDTDWNERGHPVSQHVVAERCRISLRYCRKIMAQAVLDGWLAQPRPPKRGSAGSYRLGAQFKSQLRAASAQSNSNHAQPARTTTRSPRTKKHIDVDISTYSAGPDHRPGAVAGAEDSDVAPAAAVENLTPERRAFDEAVAELGPKPDGPAGVDWTNEVIRRMRSNGVIR